MITSISAAKLMSATTSSESQRSVYKIVNPKNSNLGRLDLKNIIQGEYQNYVSPFYLFDEFGPMELPKGAPFRVDAHPHAGIIPTTYLFKGNAHHRDSMGNDFQYNQGDFIQFTSGKGALHMEETGNELYENGGTFHGIQSWLNIPPLLKKSEPVAGHLKKEDIAVGKTDNAVVRVILGEVFGLKSKIQLLMPVIYWHISLYENATIDLPVDKSQNVFVYLIEGEMEVNGHQTVNKNQAVLFERDANFIKLKAKKHADFLVLGGEVNNNKYAASGPFVLNNDEEINQAYSDFQQGKFGDLDKTNGIKRQ